MEWKVGDRVVIRPDDCWTQPRRGWAERGRRGTVTAVGRTLVGVLFDRTRNPIDGVEYFAPKDLMPPHA